MINKKLLLRKCIILFLFSILPLHAQICDKNTLGQSPCKNILFFDDREEASKLCNQYFWGAPTEVTFSLTYASKYVWRGLSLVNDSVIQPELSVSKYGFNLAIWGNMDGTNIHGHPCRFSEVDIIFGYSNSFTCHNIVVSTSAGTILYIYPHIDYHNTCELFAGFELETCLHPTIVAYYDIDKVMGWYLTCGLGHTWERILCPCKDFEMGLDLATSIGWGSSRFIDFYYSYDYTTLLNILFTISLPTTWKCWEMTPFFSASYFPNESIRDRVYPNTNYWGGVTLSRSY